MPANPPKTFKILCLDGGGAKGFYSLGVLRELEAAVGSPLSNFFDAIYGTSTGAIITTLLGLGTTVPEALKLYEEKVPAILGPRTRAGRSNALRTVGNDLFGEKVWSDFKTNIGIVATNWGAERPILFKPSVNAAHGLKATFTPGFGRSIAEAVEASCSASPFFLPCHLDLENVGQVEARDGGFCANNPSLFALTDALNAFRISPPNIRLLSVGVGHYPEPKRPFWYRLIQRTPPVHILQKTLSTNANTTEILVDLLFPHVPHKRISDRFESPEMATDFLECNLLKLNLLVQKGRESFAKRESELKVFFDNYG